MTIRLEQQPILTFGEMQDAGRLQRLDRHHHVLMNDLIDLPEIAEVHRLFRRLDEERAVQFQIFATRITSSVMSREMETLTAENGFRIGGENEAMRVPNKIPYDPRKHSAFFDKNPGDPDPKTVEVIRSQIDIQMDGKWVRAADPVLDFAITTVSPQETIVFEKRAPRKRILKTD